MKIVRKFILIMAVFSFVVATSIAYGKDVLELDGTNWLETSREYRIGYIEGFLSGEVVEHMKISFLCSSPYAPEKTIVGQIKDGVDTFYKDFANRKIKLVDAIGIVSMQINGRDPKLIEAQIRYLRTMPESNANRSSQIRKECDKYRIGEKAPHNPLYYWYTGDKEETLKAIKKGLVSKESFLRAGYYCDEQGNVILLSCYGRYK